MAWLTPSLDFFLQCRKGRIEGHTVHTVAGNNPNTDTDWNTVWSESTPVVLPTSAAQLKVSSSHTDDTSAGTGLRTIEITGLLADFTEVKEEVTLNGQTEVLTSNSFYRINRVKGLTAGSTGENQGKIYIGSGTVTAGVPATVHAVICDKGNKSCGSFYTVPKGSTAFLMAWTCTQDTSNIMHVRLRKCKPNGLWMTSGTISVHDSFTKEVHGAKGLTEGTDFQFQTQLVAGTGNSSCYLEFILADNRSG